jgi:hypothetical protein
MTYKSHTSYPIHPTEYTLLSTATMSTATATATAHATFNPDRLHSDNLSEVDEQLDEDMRLDHSITGSSIGKGIYHEEQEPPQSDVPNTTDEHTMKTFGYELAKENHFKAAKQVKKANDNHLRQRKQQSTAEYYKGSKPTKAAAKHTGKTTSAHHIPPKEVTAFCKRAAKRGYTMGTCFVCGEKHGAHTCPNYPENGGAPTIEDTDVATTTTAKDGENEHSSAALRSRFKTTPGWSAST